MMKDEIKKVIESSGGKIDNWIPVSERPDKEPFANEANYSFNDLFWGKIHLRNDGDLYVLIISKIVFNWKDKRKDLKLNGEIIDAAGGLMWVREYNIDGLKRDMDYIKSYLNSLRQQQKTS